MLVAICVVPSRKVLEALWSTVCRERFTQCENLSNTLYHPHLHNPNSKISSSVQFHYCPSNPQCSVGVELLGFSISCSVHDQDRNNPGLGLNYPQVSISLAVNAPLPKPSYNITTVLPFHVSHFSKSPCILTT